MRNARWFGSQLPQCSPQRVNETARNHYLQHLYSLTKERFATHSPAEVEAWVKGVFAQQPDFTLEYFTITDAHTLQSITKKEAGKDYRAFIVVRA